MCIEIEELKSMADKFIKMDLRKIDNSLSSDDKMHLVNSLATLNVLGDYIKNSIIAGH